MSYPATGSVEFVGADQVNATEYAVATPVPDKGTVTVLLVAALLLTVMEPV